MGRWIKRFVLGLGLCVLLSCLIGLFPVLAQLPLQVVYYVFLSWTQFLARVGPQIELNATGITLAVVSLAAVFAVTDSIARRWRGNSQPEGTADTSRQWQPRWTVTLVSALLSTFAAGVCLVGVVHEMLWLWRANPPAVRIDDDSLQFTGRLTSKKNLKRIGLALHNYHDQSLSLPPGGEFGPRGEAMHGWMTRILPFVEQHALYNQIQFDKPWSHAHNKPVFTASVDGFTIPNRGRIPIVDQRGYALTHYAGNVLVLGDDRPMKLSEITDGTSNTLLAGEVRSQFKPWGHPANWRDPRLGINQSEAGFGGPWKGGMHFLMADGTMRFVNEKIDAKILEAMATPAGGESVSDF